MKLQDWKTKFAPQILRRGENYFQEGAVHALDWDGETLRASVYGTETYEVEIGIADGQVLDMYCSCPYAEEANCKHMAAVLRAASEDDFPGEKQKAKRQAEKSLKDAVQTLAEADARELLWKFARKYPAIAEHVMLKSVGRVTDAQIQAWMKQITSLEKKYSGRDGFIEYRNAHLYIRDMKALLNEKIPILLECAMPLKAFELTCKALSEASQADMDDSDGGVGSLYWICMEHWKTMLPHMNQEERHKMFDWFQENYRRWSVSDDVLDYFLFNDSKWEGAFSEPEFLRRKLELLDAQIAKAPEDSYLLNHCVSYRLDTMEKLSMGKDEIERYMREHYQIRSIRERMADQAIRENRLEDAVEILRESKKMDAKYPGCVSEYSGKLVELYQRLHRTEELRAELMFQITEFYQENLRCVEALKAITPPEQWPQLREQLLSMKKLSWIRGQILEWEGLYQRLLDDALSSKSMAFMDPFVETLETKYPDNLREFYADCLRREMKETANQKKYAECVKRLKWLARFPGGEETAVQIAQEWRAAYPRRRTLLEVLRKEGF